jgi:hypothetical protein
LALSPQTSHKRVHQPDDEGDRQRKSRVDDEAVQKVPIDLLALQVAIANKGSNHEREKEQKLLLLYQFYLYAVKMPYKITVINIEAYGYK